jgi:type I restriction enzyme M protein
MPIKKSELYSSLWKSCDELRGGMDASQYKDYVLVLLFVKYVSDKYADQPGAPIEVPPGGRFADMTALKGDKEIGDKINKIIRKLADANELVGTIDVADFNDEDRLGKGKEIQDRLSNLVAIFQNPALDFSRNRAEGDDLLGDAYEYLMRHFATESGKSKGQFYTPAEVSIVMAKIIGIANAKSQDKTLYDPTAGSGSLLLRAADESPRGVTIYGQEMDNATVALARMNMILHNNPTALIWKGNTLAEPHWTEKDGRLKQFDYVVANFPFSNKAWTSGFNPYDDVYGRFEDGVPPQKNGDYAFLLHILRSMKSTGKGAVILPHGVLFRGNAEAEIRQNLIRKGVIKGIIGLPPNLFYGTGIPACIIVLDKEHAAARAGLFMIDASQGFMKDGNKNRLRHQDIHRIVDVFNRQIEVPKYSRMVPLAEISDPKNDYNLNLPRYIDSTEPEDVQDIEAHLRGGIPDRDVDDLRRYWQVCPAIRASLFSPTDRPGYSQLSIVNYQLSIKTHPEFVAYMQTIHDLFARWQAKHAPRLRSITVGDRPKRLIETLAEDALATFADAPLIDPYDVYQHVMTYWADAMQDDVYILVADGWAAGGKLRLIEEDKKEEADLKIGKLKYKADLIPPALIVARYFADDSRAIEALEAEREALARQMEELDEEHGGEEGLLFESKNDKGKLTKGSVAARVEELTMDNGQWTVENGQLDADAAAELEVLGMYLRLIEQEAEAAKKVREAQKTLDARVVARYAALTVDEVKALVVDDKWLSALAAAVQTELDRVSQALTGRIKQLAERYAVPSAKLSEEVEALGNKVDAHLKKMGFAVNG